MWWRKRRRIPDSRKLGNLTLWETVDRDGEEVITFAEMTSDPEMAPAVEQVKQIMRDQGWSQTAGD